jgi:16S rRNA G966 N2-methylase RsmD
MSDLQVQHRLIADLKPQRRNARTHTPKQIHQIAASIKEFGFTAPVLVDPNGTILAGHARVEAAQQLGMERVPTILIDHLSEPQKRAYVLADNRLAELAGWDTELLALELQHLTEIDLDFEVEITGFETGEIDVLIEGLAAAPDETDILPDVDETSPPVSRVGDLWLLGEHRLLCGDARDPAAYETLMAGESAQMVFIDPPYNVPIDGHVCGSGRVKHAEFVMASGEMSEPEFTAFLETVLHHLAGNSVVGSIHFVCMDWRHAFELLTAGRAAYTELKNLCVWNKSNAGMGSLYRSQHELVFVFKSGTAPHINNVELGRHGRYRTNVWNYPGINTLKPGRLEELAMHPTVKPAALVADAIKDCSRRGGVVLDAFAGSGTTIIAAERTARRARALELDPRYVDVALRRWQDLTNQDAVNAETGSTFAQITDSRLGAPAEPRPVTGQEARHG